MTPPGNSSTAPLNSRFKLSQSGSLFLDVVRFLAALAVLVHHFVDLRFSVGWGNIGALGHQAVCVFFVLSGFVIRFISVTRVDTPMQYAIDRVSRIYSVVLPALLFTVVCEAIAKTVHPAAYALMTDHVVWRLLPAQIVANVTFLAQCWGYGIDPLSNVSFWSLSYECIYYLLYLLIHYRIRNGLLWSILVLLIAGPNIALLAPIWLLGSLTCDLYLALSRRGSGQWLAGLLLAAILVLLGAARHWLVALLQATDHDARTLWLAQLMSGSRLFPYLRYNGRIPWLSEASLSYYLVGAVTAAAILFGLLFLDRHHPSLPPAVTRWTRLIADSTFTLYLFHMPMLVLIAVLVGHPISSGLASFLSLFAIVASTVPIAIYLDTLKGLMRTALRRRFASHTA
jgi:peptidoglycan/LPS O-acetylase OafA/YrhL